MNRTNPLKVEDSFRTQILAESFELKEAREEVKEKADAETEEIEEEYTEEEVEAIINEAIEEGKLCPLCESFLEDALTDDQLGEHIENVLKFVDELNEEADEEE